MLERSFVELAPILNTLHNTCAKKAIHIKEVILHHIVLIAALHMGWILITTVVQVQFQLRYIYIFLGFLWNGLSTGTNVKSVR